MKRTVLTLSLLLWTLIGVAACEREGPPRPVGSATNKHVEESPAPLSRDTDDRRTGAMKSPLEQAHQAKGVLQGAAEPTRRQTEHASP